MCQAHGIVENVAGIDPEIVGYLQMQSMKEVESFYLNVL